MKYHLTQRFYFEAAHTLQRQIDAVGSRRVHGHTYICEVTLSGTPDPHNGMLLDLGFFKQRLECVRELLDHHLLNEVHDLGLPRSRICALSFGHSYTHNYTSCRASSCAAKPVAMVVR